MFNRLLLRIFHVCFSQYQMDDNVIRSKWDVFGDPCPAVFFEWAIERTDGFIMQNFTDTSGRCIITLKYFLPQLKLMHVLSFKLNSTWFDIYTRRC